MTDWSHIRTHMTSVISEFDPHILTDTPTMPTNHIHPPFAALQCTSWLFYLWIYRTKLAWTWEEDTVCFAIWVCLNSGYISKTNSEDDEQQADMGLPYFQTDKRIKRLFDTKVAHTHLLEKTSMQAALHLLQHCRAIHLLPDVVLCPWLPGSWSAIHPWFCSYLVIYV